MPRLPVIATLAIVTACAPVPPPAVGSATLDGVSYPIESVEGRWSVIADGQRIACRTATEEDCLWALRHYRTSQDALDSLG